METDNITEEEVQKAVDYLRDSSTKCAKARAELIYVTEYRKSLKAILMKKHGELAYSGQEREAYAEQEYKKHLASNAAHVLKQPNHYRGMFDILN